jgi:hypothetical protein
LLLVYFYCDNFPIGSFFECLGETTQSSAEVNAEFCHFEVSNNVVFAAVKEKV